MQQSQLITHEDTDRCHDEGALPSSAASDTFQCHAPGMGGQCDRLIQAQRAFEKRLARVTQVERAALEEARMYSQLKQNFLSNVSHELRTPLTVLQGYLSILSQDALGPLTTEQQEALQVAMRNLDRLNHLVSDLLDYSTLARCEAVLASEPVDLAEVCHKSLEHVSGLAQMRHITVESRLGDTLDLVCGDRAKLQLIVSHLLENAIKYSGSGQHVMLSLTQRDDHLCIAVSDTGVGMTPEQLARAFAPFVQGESGLSRRFDGLGMGLTLIHHLVTLHGGDIHITSSSGNGTTVTITLPAMG